MAEARKPGDVDVKAATITNFKRTRRFDISQQIVSLNIYEDIFKNTMYGNITFVDRMNSVQELPILGEEYFQITFINPVFPNEPFSHEFFIYSINNVQTGNDGKSTLVSLSFISVEHLENNKKLMSVSFKNGKMSDYIKQLVSDFNYLNSGKQFFKFKETTETFKEPFAFPYQTCFELIDYFRNFSHDLQDPASAFLFFENSKGFNFTTVNDLIQNPVTKPIKLNYYPKSQKDPNIQPEDSINTIAAIEYKNINDTLTAVRKGMFASKVSSFDFVKKTEFTSTFKLNEEFDKFSHLDGSLAGLKNSDMFIEQLLNNKYGLQDKGLFVQKNYLIPENSSRGETGILDSLPRRVAQTELLVQTPIIIQMLGNPQIYAGSIVSLDIPEPTHNFTVMNEGRPQRYMSGNYLVGRVVHTIEVDTYKMTLNVFKESFQTKIVEQDPFYAISESSRR